MRFRPCLLLALILAVSSCSSSPADPELGTVDPRLTAQEIVAAMGDGFNLGNTFDLDLHSTDFAELQPLIATYQLAGMKHVRIPVTWMEGFGGNTLADENGRVNTAHTRFRDLKRIIDYALDRGLYVVINAHHERAFKEHYDGGEAYNAQFASLWTDIATIFKDYPQQLIFELLNEPEGAFGTWGGPVSPQNPTGIALTRQIMQVGVEAVRATGGLNTDRLIMIATNGQGNHSQIDEVYPTKTELPSAGDDAYIAIQVHTYDPWGFCGQDGRNSAFPGAATIEQSLRTVATHARRLGVPVNYGEFGVGRRTSQSERNSDTVRSFYRTIVRVAREEGMSTSVWDDRGWFGLVSGSAQTGYTFLHDIVPTMLAE